MKETFSTSESFENPNDWRGTEKGALKEYTNSNSRFVALSAAIFSLITAGMAPDAEAQRASKEEISKYYSDSYKAHDEFFIGGQERRENPNAEHLHIPFQSHDYSAEYQAICYSMLNNSHNSTPLGKLGRFLVTNNGPETGGMLRPQPFDALLDPNAPIQENESEGVWISVAGPDGSVNPVFCKTNPLIG